MTATDSEIDVLAYEVYRITAKMGKSFSWLRIFYGIHGRRTKGHRRQVTMAAGWVHQIIDLVAYGRTYAHVHRGKDAAAQVIPGTRHRIVGHEWYQRFGRDWNFDCPYPQVAKECIEKLREAYGPDVAEERMSSDSHDLIDRTWDEVSKEQRLCWEGFFAWLLYHPEVLERWAEVDVIRGRIKRIVNGNGIWEDAPEIVGEYKRLRREVSRHQKWRLRTALAHFG